MKVYLPFSLYFVLGIYLGLLVGCTPSAPVTAEIPASSVNPLVAETEQRLLDEYLAGRGEMEVEKTDPAKNFHFEGQEINYATIQPILKANCYACHRPDGPAPFSLTDYSTVKKKSLAIADALRAGIMPPWKADNAYNSFVNAPPINAASKAMLLHWLDHACIPGKAKDVKTTFGPVLAMTVPALEEYEIASDEDAYYYSRFDPQLTADLKVSFIDYTESNPSIVHHRTLFIDTCGLLLNAERSQKEYEELLNELTPFTAWSKGMIPCELTDNFYYDVPAGAKFLLQTHYQGDGNVGKRDKFALNLYRSTSTGHKIEFGLENKRDILYPANEVTTETISYDVRDSISVVGIIPHMHYICRKVECYALVGDRKFNLLKIPEWDYYFQGMYMFRKPQILPAGATVYMSIVLDNTDQNIYQPNDPIRDVVYAQDSKDEMLTLVVLHTKTPVDSKLDIAQPIYQ